MSGTRHDTFLRTEAFDPDAPACGDGVVDLAFAGLHTRVEGLSHGQGEHVARKFAALVAPGAPSAARITIRRGPPSAFRVVPIRDFEYVLALDHDAARVRVSGLRFHATITRPPAAHATVWTDYGDDVDFLDAFENVFRILSTYRMAADGHLVLHSAGFIAEGRGVLAFGHSGAGKTTLTSMADGLGLEILSDELNAVVWRGGVPTLLAMPFAGDFGRARYDAREAPLSAVFRLRQATSAHIAPLSLATQVGELVASCPFINADPGMADAVFSHCARLARRVPVGALHFAKDTSWWPVVRAHALPSAPTQ